ncbi:hypothetical protein JCM5353_006405 [Sporobolomyces roseus]
MISNTLLRPLLCLIRALVALITLLSVRLFLVLLDQHSSSNTPPKRQQDDPATLAIFLGSGGHTAEMMRLVSNLDWNRFTSRTWIISSGDQLSESKALELEEEIGSGHFRILKIPRARRVKQSYLTSPFTTLYSLAFCLWHISFSPLSYSRQRKFADLILLNGPGSCVPIATSAFLPKLFFLPSPLMIYVESLARTRRLSLSAKLVRPLVNRFFVQWESLRVELIKKEKGKNESWRLTARVEYQGWLV